MTKKIAILLATYNSTQFLAEQLDSLEKQTYSNWFLYALDDGSSDDTLEILMAYQEKWGKSKLIIFSQPNKGCTYSFLSLVCNGDIKADYYAYCDHDDVWEETKLERAISILERNESEIPLLYCSSAKLVDQNNKIIGHSTIYKKPPCFRNALVQNIASGNTMVFNKRARDLMGAVGIVDVPIHDWWTYLLITACGGKVLYDALSFIRYRQHGGNLIGYGGVRIRSFQHLSERTKKFYSQQRKYQHCLKNVVGMTASAKKTSQAFENSMYGNLAHRLFWFYKSRVFRQTWRETVKLYIAMFLFSYVT